MGLTGAVEVLDGRAVKRAIHPLVVRVKLEFRNSGLSFDGVDCCEKVIDIYTVQGFWLRHCMPPFGLLIMS